MTAEEFAIMQWSHVVADSVGYHGALYTGIAERREDAPASQDHSDGS
jgi:hypothetical protein